MIDAEPSTSDEAKKRERTFVYLLTAFTWFSMITLSGALAFAVVAALHGPEALTDLEGEAVTDLMTEPLNLVLGIAVSSLTMAAAAVFGVALSPGATALGRSFAARLGFRRVPAVDVAVVTLGTLGLGAALDSLVFFSGLRDTGSLGMLHRVLGDLSGPALWITALAVGGAPGLGEELFFRGYLLRSLRRIDGTKVALLVSSLAFGFFHFDLVHTPAATALGLYLGVMVLFTGSLWTSVIAHAVNNAVATLLAGVAHGATEHGTLLVTGVISAVFALRFVARRRTWPDSTSDPTPR